MSDSLMINSNSWAGSSTETRTGYAFFTNEEGPDNPLFTRIVAAMNEEGAFTFNCRSDIRLIEMRHVTWILSQKADPKVVRNSVPLKFNFSNGSSVTMRCCIEGVDIKDTALVMENTIGKCKKVGEVLSFSNGEETIVANRRFLISVHVKLPD